MTVLVMVSCGSIIPTLGAVSVSTSEQKLARKRGKEGSDELALFFRL